MIEASGLTKSFGGTPAVSGLDLAVAAGTTFCLLGPNGAGKTTAVRILATLVGPDTGRARVAGHDVLTDGAAVRRAIGLAGQYAALDEFLTGRANLVMVAELCRLPRAAARRRAAELLARFDLADAADRPVRTYSGGMRRRLDLAAGLVTRPAVLFLDEPTTGLDPRGRLALWEVVRGLARDGTTVLLTTQYLEEADQLADRVAVVDRGRVVVEGTPSELKAAVGGTRLVLTLSGEDLGRAPSVLARFASGALVRPAGPGRVEVPVVARPALISDVVHDLAVEGIGVDDAALRQPTLDDVFHALTSAAGAAA